MRNAAKALRRQALSTKEQEALSQQRKARKDTDSHRRAEKNRETKATRYAKRLAKKKVEKKAAEGMESVIDAWMYKLQEELLGEFGERLVLLGLQGSRAREEARADSDIDIAIVIDGLDFASLQVYKEALSRMPNADLACGFISSLQVLAGWPRYDSFNLFMDTSVCYGSFDFVDTGFTADDALDAADAGASV